MAFELSVELTGKIDGLRDNFNAAIREVGKLDKDTRAKLASVDKGFADLANKIDQSIGKKAVQSTATASNAISKNLASIAASSNNMGGKVAKGSDQAAFALTNLGRVAQDAPFGFIGIQNNLNPLLESFQRLKAETGTTGSALKALGSSLIGPAGLGIAFSVISSAILFYNQYQQKAARETENSESAMKKAKKTAEEYALSLDEVTRANLIGSQNAARELVDLKLLYDTTQNLTLSTKLRADAVDTLQEKYPSYFKNIKDENILNGQAEDVYNKLTVAILASSKARAAGDIMAENDKRNFTNIQKRNDLEVQYGKILSQQSVLQKALTSPEQAGSARENARQLANLEEERAGIAEQIRSYKRDEEIITGRNLKLSGAILDFQKQGAEIDGKVGGGGQGTKERVKDVKTLSDVLAELDVSIIQIDNSFQTTFDERSKDKIKSYQKAIDELIKMGYAPASKAVEDLKKAQQDLFILPNKGKSPIITPTPGNPLSVQGNNTKGGNAVSFLEAEQEAILRSQFKFNEDFNKLVEGGITGGLANLGSSIGEAMANGGSVLEAAGASLLSGFGGFLKEYGRLLIAYGTAAVFKAKLDAAALIPGAGLIAGPAAIAAGIALTIAGSAIGAFVSGKSSNGGKNTNGREATAFANGGIISGPTLGLMGEYAGAKNNPEVVAPLSKLSDMIGASKGLSDSISKNVINTFAGNSSSVVSSGTIQKVRGERQETAIFIADSKIIGEDIHTSFRRVDKRLGRV